MYIEGKLEMIGYYTRHHASASSNPKPTFKHWPPLSLQPPSSRHHPSFLRSPTMLHFYCRRVTNHREALAVEDRPETYLRVEMPSLCLSFNTFQPPPPCCIPLFLLLRLSGAASLLWLRRLSHCHFSLRLPHATTGVAEIGCFFH